MHVSVIMFQCGCVSVCLCVSAGVYPCVYVSVCVCYSVLASLRQCLYVIVCLCAFVRTCWKMHWRVFKKCVSIFMRMF